MTLISRLRPWIGVGVAAVLLATAVGTAAGTWRTVRMAGDRIEVLGSGDAVSILVTSGQSRLLIATGDDRTAFGNAFDRVQTAPRMRLDVVLVAGSGRDLTVPAFVVETFSPREAFATHPLSVGNLAESGLAALEQLPRNPVRVILGDGVSVVIESVPLPDEEHQYAWRALITRASTVVAVISDGAHVPLFAWTSPVSAVVAALGGSEAMGDVIDARSVVAAASDLDTSAHQAGDRPNVSQSARYAVPVRPGDVAAFEFVEGGLRLSGEFETIEAPRQASIVEAILMDRWTSGFSEARARRVSHARPA